MAQYYTLQTAHFSSRSMTAFKFLADTEMISAKVDQGVLDVEIRKKKSAGGSRQISISGAE